MYLSYTNIFVSHFKPYCSTSPKWICTEEYVWFPMFSMLKSRLNVVIFHLFIAKNNIYVLDFMSPKPEIESIIDNKQTEMA